jgi:hypothetical protein
MAVVIDPTTGITAPSAAISGALSAGSETIGTPLPLASGGTGVSNAVVFTAYTEATPVAVTFPLTTPKTIAHGLGGIPKLYAVVIRCTTAEQGYSINDEVPVTNGQDLYTVGNFRTASDATNITIVGSGSTIYVSNKTNGTLAAITAANWSYVVRAWR